MSKRYEDIYTQNYYDQYSVGNGHEGYEDSKYTKDFLKMCIRDRLMTVYNGEQYVVPQIESILNQTDSNWKLFIQDDCSTDRTVELIEPYVRRYPERITLLRNEKNSGSAQKLSLIHI